MEDEMLAEASLKLADDHVRLDGLLQSAKAALANTNFSLALTQVDQFWAQLAVHIRAEHLCLFPALIDAVENPPGNAADIPTRSEVNTAIAQLRADHDFFMKALSKAVGELRATQEEPSGVSKRFGQSMHDAVTTVERRLVSHNAKEETELYRWISKLLPPDAQKKLAEAVTAQLENLPPRFIEIK